MRVLLELGLSMVFLLTGLLKLSADGGPDAKLFPKLGLPLEALRPLGTLQILIASSLAFSLFWPRVGLFSALVASAYFTWALMISLQAKQFRDAAQVAPITVLCLTLVSLEIKGNP